MFVVLLGVFSVIFSTDPNYHLNPIIGLFLWDFFSESTKAGIGSLHVKGFLITRAKFPNWIVVLTSSSNALFTLVLFLVLIIVYVSAFRRPLGVVEIGLLCYYLVAYFVVVLGFSLASNVLFLRYRDLNQIWDLSLAGRLLRRSGDLPFKHHPRRAAFLPLPLVADALHFQFTRSILVDGAIPTQKPHLLLMGNALGVLVVGILLFRNFGPRAVGEL